MARTFGGVSTDKVTTHLTTHATTRSYALWFIRTGTGGGAVGRLFDKLTVGTTVEILYDDTGTSGGLAFQRVWTTTAGVWTFAMPSSNVWHHLVVTYDAGSVANNPIIYVDGASVSVTRQSTPVGAVKTNTDPFVLGNRGSDNARNWQGTIAEFAAWDRILSANEAQALFRSGPAMLPDFVRWVPLWGVASPELEVTGVGDAQAVVTGTVRANHPPVAPFSPLGWNNYPQFDVAAGGVTFRRSLDPRIGSRIQQGGP